MDAKTTANAPTFRMRDSFSDAGELGRILGFDMGFRQLTATPQNIDATIIAGKHIALLSMHFNCAYHQCAYAPPGAITLGIPEFGSTDYFGIPYPEGGILPFNHTSGIDIVSRAGFRAYTISIAEEFLQDISASTRLPLCERAYSPARDTIFIDAPETANLRDSVRPLFRKSQLPLSTEKESDLAIDFLRATADGQAANDRSTPSVRAEAVRKALDCINQLSATGLTVSELCSATDVPWRTLSRAFNERFGIGPKKYLKSVRLAAVRSTQATVARRYDVVLSVESVGDAINVYVRPKKELSKSELDELRRAIRADLGLSAADAIVFR